MTKILDNNNLSTVDGEYNTVLSPTNKLAKGIKAILEVFEENGVPKYKVNDVAKIFGSILSVGGVPQGTYNFTTDPNAELSRLDGLIDSLDGSKADKDTAFVYIDLGIQDLVNKGTFDIPDVQRFTRDNAVMLEVSDNTTGKHRNFMRTQISADGNIITFVESVDMGTKKAPSINEIDVNVANSTGTYTEVALQNRLSQIDLDNIASIDRAFIKTLIADFGAGKSTWTNSDMETPIVAGKMYLIEYSSRGMNDSRLITAVYNQGTLQFLFDKMSVSQFVLYMWTYGIQCDDGNTWKALATNRTLIFGDDNKTITDGTFEFEQDFLITKIWEII